MADVTTPQPPSSSSTSSPSRRKPVPLRALPPIELYDWGENAKPLPGVPKSESPRLRQSPVSPVKVSFLPDDRPRSSNANIETTQPQNSDQGSVLLDRALPKTPDAPTPPPHSPRDDHDLPQEAAPRGALTIQAVVDDAEKPLPTLALQSAKLRQGGAVLSPELDDASLSDRSRRKDVNRHSRESDTTASTSQLQASTESSAATSASSVFGINEVLDGQNNSGKASPESSLIEYGAARAESVPQLQYHHAAFLSRPASVALDQDPRAQSNPNLVENAGSINRHLTPSSNYNRRSSLPRPHSSYSIYSDFGPRGRSPGVYGGAHNRAPSAHSRKSPETRPSSFLELLNVPYPQPAPAPITFDNSQLRLAVGNNASLLSAQKTLEMYRQNVKKTNDMSIQYSFAVFLIATVQEQGLNFDEPRRTKSPGPGKDLDKAPEAAAAYSAPELVREARAILQKLSNNGYPFAQYYLADGYASGLFSKGKEDYNSAFPLFVLAAKHGHAESAYRTGLCYEFGWGCRKDPTKAVQFLRTAASKRHPGAMTRLGKACLSGDLGEKRYREGIKWLKLAAESADTMYNAAPYHLGCLYETGYGDDIFQDEDYAAELFTQAADLGHPEANYRMGDAYEHGKLRCPRDPALSVHFYTGAAERGHAAAMMGLCAWYMVGAEPVLEKDEEEAYEWARRSADLGYVKAQYAVGYFTEMGVGCRRDILEANVWYVKAADAGEERAKIRLAAIRAAVSGGTPMEVAAPRNAKIKKSTTEKDDKECKIM
ncbi:hypothetical protein B0T26DRAFT_659097 [Lasiosphaeria miniovina]|uniref:Protein SKT5 n=1 Tax=Lasiosphaeria miniovina TaxID=1954250 RepID=A0AA39ZUG7_9PEZI|nr:uncharacterized protein B0T26DRAFT_659097 [Lasiosphaeria miniovina]KAK0703793.1 hypothetical protein B0T26DRAFT_659097 [Lasiosphaeria miniovina]